MTEQPNKPGGAFKGGGDTRDPGDRQAVENQSSVAPKDYPEPASGDSPTNASDTPSQ